MNESTAERQLGETSSTNYTNTTFNLDILHLLPAVGYSGQTGLSPSIYEMSGEMGW